jgi:predicted nucleotidyltransferase
LLLMNVTVDNAQIEAFCAKWLVTELAAFGSVIRDDFGPQSDVDLLIKFRADAGWSLFDMVDMQDELEKMFGRKVDMVEIDAVRNPIRRQSMLSSREVLYAA